MSDDLEQTKRAPASLHLHELIASRWSPRSFDEGRDVSSADLTTILAAAAWAASSNNEQPWRFLVGRKGDATFTKILDTLVEANQAWAHRAPVLILSAAKATFTPPADTGQTVGRPNAWGMHDTGAASATMCLQAIALGIHTHGMAGFDRDKARASFGLPDDYEPGAVWALGYAGSPEALTAEWQKAAELAPRSRKPLNAYVFAEWDIPAAL